MADATFWWIFAGVAVAAELVTGTFYLLMLGLGLAAGAIAAHAGASMTVQIVAAALVGGGAVAIWYGVRSRQPKGAPSSANRDINLDIGGTLNVDAWNTDRTAAVKYRGAEWTAELSPEAIAAPGAHRIVEMVGSRLIVEPLK
jgi:membrane protein implicated in regulation of membrane protease activity